MKQLRRVRSRFARYLGGRRALLSICIGSYFAVRFAQVAIGPIVPSIVETFTVSRSAVGLGLTGMWIAYALSQLPSGVLADRFGGRQVVLAALVVTAVATLGIALSPSFLAFGIATFALGIGAGIYYNPATTLLTVKFDEVGKAIGIHRIGGQAAGVLAPLFAAIVTVRLGWRSVVTFSVILTVSVGMVFLYIRSSPDSPREDWASRKRFSKNSLLRLIAHRHMRNTTFLMTIVEFVGLATMAFLPLLLVEQFNFSIERSNLLFAAFFAVSALCQPISGWLSDRFGRDVIVIVQMIAGVLGYGILTVGGIQLLAVLGVIFAGIAVSSTPVIQSRMIDGLGEAARGTGFGLFRTVYLLFGASGTTVVGVIADWGGWFPAFGLLTALFAGTLVVLILTQLST